MISNGLASQDLKSEETCNRHTVHFGEIIHTNDDGSPSVAIDGDNRHVLFTTDQSNQQVNSRQKSGILKRRENTITTADAPRITLSDEGLKAGRVSPFINFPLFLSMTIQSVGVIFGDIGTSPLYVLKTLFDSPPEEDAVIGAISLIAWSLIVIVSLKYAIFILMADNRGEGGPFALCGLLTGPTDLHYRTKQLVSIVSMIAACLLLGDGALTPAVTILSAFEGLVFVNPSLQSWTVRLSVIIIICLFLVQRWGLSRIGMLFGPIMMLWFILLATIGIWRITYKPVIFKALNPWKAMHYLIKTKKQGFYQIGSVFLSVTGLETLYADLGYFGRWPIRFSWFTLIFPAVLLNYLGQGALIILYPTFIDNPFYRSLPHWALIPMLVCSVIAATIASQSIISGSFSLVSQAIAMGFCVPFTVIHTSRSIIGQIYVPAINYFLLALTLAVTIGFQTSNRITDAYGVTVCSLMVITTILYMMVMRWTWLKPIWLVALFGIFLIIDLYTFAAIYATKIASGGWVAIIIAFSLFIFSFSWFYGNTRLNHYLSKNCKTNSIEDLPNQLGLKGFDCLLNDDEQSNIILTNNDDDDDDDDQRPKTKNNKRTRLINSEQQKDSISIVENLQTSISVENVEGSNLIKNNYVIIRGVGCFLTTSKKFTPYVFENFLNRTHAHQEILIFLKIEYARMPSVDDDQRLIVRTFGNNIFHITSIFGYAETNISLFKILHLAQQLYNVPITTDESKITFFLPNETIHVNTHGWRAWLRFIPLYIYSILKQLYPGIPLNVKSVPENTIYVGILADC
ncbi:unnamed protein product [Rotaria socialis]|uniref:Potassium transporter n=1 Tax=Rotaria socialis TaxID=392032 RepID=A0A820KAE0_9BILA|nr:unnamed protein product [Rotaria socialis]CAF3265424.1 unnamed protein product [Rotaria socialis]CAF4337330.1 unnamed protein product [Rotaria socialis]CAF4455466.1 unnamed protein product [Rotaria socialis]